MSNSASNNALKIIQWNCRSIKDKRTELQIIIDEENPHVIALNETWLNDDEAYNIHGYKSVRKDRDDGYGGVLLAFKESMQVAEVDIQTDFECVCCTVELENTEHLSIICMYVPNSTPLLQQNLDSLLDQVTGPKLILGDFNAHGMQ